MEPRPVDTTTPPMSGTSADTGVGATDESATAGSSGATGDSGTAGPSGQDPVEGRPDLGLPGADRGDIPPGRQDDLPERLGKRIENGSSSGLAAGEPDVLPDVEVPEETM